LKNPTQQNPTQQNPMHPPQLSLLPSAVAPEVLASTAISLDTRAPLSPASPAPGPPLALACLVIPALPLQILALRDANARDQPAVVVTEDRPQGIILWTNRLARAIGVLPGMRYAAALAVHGDLRAGVVAEPEIDAAVLQVSAILRQFSPRVEPSHTEPGVFWLDASGLDGLFGSLERWATELRAHLLEHGWHAVAATGWQRYALYAIARHFRGIRVCRDPQHEARLEARVALSALGPALGLPAQVRDALALLGIQTLGQFLALPEAALRERHGPEAFALHRLARGQIALPLRPELPVPLPEATRDLEPPDDNAERLLFIARGLLAPLLRELAVRREAVATIRLTLELEQPRQDMLRDRQGQDVSPTPPSRLVEEVLRPAEPTLQEALLVDLIRLKLENLTLAAGVERMRVLLQPVTATAAQLRLWQLAGRRDPEAARLALARVRAAFGPQAIVHAELRSGHLPEARFAWVPMETVPLAKPGPLPEVPPLCRRVYAKPLPLPARPRREPDGWLLGDWRQGHIVKSWGPFRITGGWWVREVRRDYHYVQTERGNLLWVYWDGVRRAWFVHGEID
jgi:protein ImuB